MINYTNLDNVKLEHTAVALGKFDGLHRGHQLLLRKLSEYKKQGYKTVIFTFDFHPASLLTGKKQQLIYTRKERHNIIEQLGADVLIEFPFTKETAHMSPDDFVKNILVDIIGTQIIVVGNDFHFGYKRSGDVPFLRGCQDRYGFRVDSCEKLTYNGAEISSTLIRECIREGKMELVNELLGRPYSVSGPVVHGKGNGRTVDMPTANVMPDEFKLLPPDGVYASKTRVNGGRSVYTSVTNIGTNPTVGENNARSIETFISDFDGDLYGQEIHIDIYKMLRAEQKFEDLKALRLQVQADRQNAQDFFRSDKK